MLHESIKAAVEQRLAVAQAAAGWGHPPWRYAPLSMNYDGIMGARGEHVMTFAHHLEPVVDVVAFIAANDPARVIRDCQRDLKVLERHAPGNANYCSHGPHASIRYPCVEIRDLAEAYDIPAGDTPYLLNPRGLHMSNDPELEALKDIVSAMEELDEVTQDRIAGWVYDRYRKKDEAMEPDSQD